MSAIGGMFVFGSGVVDAGTTEALGARLARLGPDGGRELVDGAVAVAHRAFHTTAQSRRERQPLCHGHRLLLAWDGRLDNRPELIPRLGDLCGGDDTDAAIALAAYRRWGDDAFAILVGDFALALWDARDRAVRLARDGAGTRALHYHVDARRLIWSTDLAALAELSGRPLEVDEEYVAGFLGGSPAPGVTPYAGIHAVKPGHVVRVDGDGLASERCFWSAEPRDTLRLGSDADYEQHFRAVFGRAVGDRLRSDAPVFSHLSGGLDSSSIVCMADRVLDAAGRPRDHLRTLSYVFDEAAPADERKWIRIVEAHRGAIGVHIPDRDAPFWTPLEDASGIATPSRLLVASAFHRAVTSALAAAGSRVVLSGHGGDHMMLSAPEPPHDVARLVRGGHLLAAHRALYPWAAAMKQPYPLLVWRHALMPLVGAPVHRPGTEPPPWFAPRFARRLRSRQPDDSDAFALAVRQLEMEAQQEPGGVEYAYPYLDRRLVEFLAAVPYAVRIRPGETRSLMRRAMAGIVPDAILRRRGKGNPTSFVAAGMARNRETLDALCRGMRAGERGYVSERGFREALARAMEGGEKYSAAVTLVLRLEVWLRLLERRRAAAARVIAADRHRAAIANGAPPGQVATA